jgi:RimJ/RimL family protein N-acetyltransferase
MRTLETDRLLIRPMTVDDAPFMLRLLNDPDWLRYIGDRGVRSVDDARVYIRNGPIAMVERLGFGFGVVETRAGGTPIGICGLAQRDYLDAPDLGFALLPEHRGQGLAYEAAVAVRDFARGELRLPRLLATTRIDNVASQRLLEKLGLRFEKRIPHPEGVRELDLYAMHGPSIG